MMKEKSNKNINAANAACKFGSTRGCEIAESPARENI